MSREMSYSPEQIEACILAYRNGDLNYCRAGIIDLLTAYAATLRQQAARVDEVEAREVVAAMEDAARRLYVIAETPEDNAASEVLLQAIPVVQAALSAQPAEHPDDAAVDRFAAAMKEKLAAARAKGRGGWQDKHDCPQQRLSNMLRDHVEKGDPRDVANFCMFLHQRAEAILPRTRTMMELAADPSLRRAAQPAERQGECEPVADVVTHGNLQYGKLRRDVPDGTKLYIHPAAPVGVPEVIEEIAKQWDGCMYDAPGETLDIGQCIRAAGKSLAAPSAPQGVDRG